MGNGRQTVQESSGNGSQSYSYPTGWDGTNENTQSKSEELTIYKGTRLAVAEQINPTEIIASLDRDCTHSDRSREKESTGNHNWENSSTFERS